MPKKTGDKSCFGDESGCDKSEDELYEHFSGINLERGKQNFFRQQETYYFYSFPLLDGCFSGSIGDFECFYFCF